MAGRAMLGSFLFMMLAGSVVQAQTITLVSAPGNFFGDDKGGNGIVCNYAVYSISNNTGVTLPSVFVAITNIVSTNRIQLASNDPGVRDLGALAPGQTKLASFYMLGPSLTGSSFTGLTNEVHTIEVLNGPVGIGSVITSARFSYTNINYVIEANPNVVTIISNLNARATLGSLVPLLIGGASGTIGSPPMMDFSPAVFVNWRPDAYQLESCVVTLSLNPTYTNRLYFDSNTPGFTNFASNTYTNYYYFRARKVTGTNVPVSPYGFIASGSQIKHTSLSSLSALGPTNSVIVSVTNAVTLGESVAPTNFYAAYGATVTYTVIISNSSTASVNLDQIVDTLPGFPDNNTSFVPNSATYNSVAITNPAISGQTLTWSLPFNVPPNGTSVFTFQAYAGYAGGQYTNNVVGMIGSEQIGTTLDTSTNNAALAVFTVIPDADVAVTKFGPANVYAASNFNYTVTVTNLGPSPASSLSVTDQLPVNASFVSSVPPATHTGNLLIWNNLGSLAGLSSTNLTVTVRPGIVAATLTNTASGGSPTTDFVPTNNASAPVFTTVTEWADVGIFKSGPGTNVLPFANFNYTILVTNGGPSIAVGVTATDAVPAGATLVSASGGGVLNGNQVIWNFGNFAPGTGTNLTVTVTAPAHGTLTNIAAAASATLDLNAANNTTPPVTTTVTNLPPVCVNDVAGTLPNTPVTIPVLANDSSPNGDTLTIVSVTQTNGTAVISGTNVVFTPATNYTGPVVLTYTVTDGYGGTNSAFIFISVSTLADLAIAKTASSDVLPGGNLTYTISVTNFGPAIATNTIVTDAVPASVTYVTVFNGGTNNGGIVTWNVGDLGYQQVTNLTLQVGAPLSGTLTNTASVGSLTGDPNLTNNTTPPVVTAISALADVGIGKSAAGSVAATSNLDYTISVTNFGPSTASSVVVTDTLPAGVTFVSASGNGANNGGVVTWNLGDLANDAVSNVIVTVTVPANGSLTNIAFVASPTTDTNSANNVTPPVITTITPIADLGIGKSAAASVSATSNLTYTISVTNFGPSDASGVVVTDVVPANATFVSASGNGSFDGVTVTWDLAILPAGASSNLTLTVTVPANGSLANVAGVSSPAADPNPSNNTNLPVVTTVSAINDIGMGKTGPAVVTATSNLDYTITVTNFGPSDASDVVVTDAVPAGATFVSASGGGINNGGVVSWDLGPMPNGSVNSVTLTVTAPANGSLANVASVSSSGSDPNLSNNTNAPVITTITPIADIGVGKAGPAVVIALSNLTYTISVTNFGPSDSSDVVVTDSLPVGVTFVSASGNGVNNSGVVSWDLGPLVSGAMTNVTVTVTAPTDGSLTNVANASAPETDPDLSNNTSSPVITTISGVADLGIGKTAAGSVSATSNLDYTISVTNFGPSIASSVTVTDAIPSGATFVSASGGGVNNSGVVTWNLGDLANGAVTNLTLTVTVPANGSLANVAGVSSPTSDPNPSNNTNPPVVTTITGIADIGLGKSAAGFVSATSNLVYTISVTNFGPSTASGVMVTDAIPVGAVFVGASGGGVNNGGVVTWSLGDMANGAVSNVTLTVTAPATGSLTNVASGGSSTSDPNPGNNSTPQVTTTVTTVADVGIGKSGAASVSATSNLVYTISVTNFGPSTASSVTVTDAVPVGATFVSASGGGVNSGGVVTWNLGDLPNGGVSNLTLTVTAPANGSLTNVASAGSSTGDPNPANNASAPVVTTIATSADVGIGKSGAASVSATSNLVYTISVTNFGPSTATSVTVTDAIPAGATFVSTSGGGVNNGSVITWSLGDMASGAVSNVTLTVAAPANGSLTNVASAGSPTSDPNPANNASAPVVTTVTTSADIGLGKTAASSVTATSNLVYTISATNFGPSTASSVTVTDAIPSGATFVSASGGGVNNGGVVTWNLGNLLNGAVSNVTLTVKASAAGSLTNTASGGSSTTSDPNLSNNTSPPVITTVTNAVTVQADLAVFKTGSTNGITGSNVVYTITVTNLGPSTASNIVVSDALPIGMTFVSGTVGSTVVGNIVSWSVVKLAANAQTNFTLTANAGVTGTFTNIAYCTATTPDPNPTNNNGSSPSSQVLITVVPVQFAVVGGGTGIVQIGPNTYRVTTNALNHQTGLYEESVTVTNTGIGTVAGVRLLVSGLRANVTLYNATGTNAGVPYVEYDLPLDPSNAVTFTLEFYNPFRVQFTNTVTAVGIIPAGIVLSGTNGVAVSNVFMDSRIAGDTRFVIEFSSVIGATYTVLYKDSLAATNWMVATPSITASANITQWYDDGPPKTVSKPATVSSRFYRVIKN